ncbi:MAG: hypothetical protein RL067_849 [Verrucomicrobiota bacterium]
MTTPTPPVKRIFPSLLQPVWCPQGTTVSRYDPGGKCLAQGTPAAQVKIPRSTALSPVDLTKAGAPCSPSESTPMVASKKATSGLFSLFLSTDSTFLRPKGGKIPLMEGFDPPLRSKTSKLPWRGGRLDWVKLALPKVVKGSAWARVTAEATKGEEGSVVFSGGSSPFIGSLSNLRSSRAKGVSSLGLGPTIVASGALIRRAGM